MLHNFESNSTTDGNTPVAGLIRDPAGNLYGTTYYGGAFGGGTVFEVSPKGNEKVVYSFCAETECADGSSPGTGLLLDGAGDFWGATSNGGTLNGGAVFKIEPGGAESVFFSFNPFNTDGYGPSALVEDKSGNFYGTGSHGGIRDNGVVFRLGSSAQETVLHRFRGAPQDGSEPAAGVIRDSAGNLYGTTMFGGSVGQQGCGTVFKLGR